MVFLGCHPSDVRARFPIALWLVGQAVPGAVWMGVPFEGALKMERRVWAGGTTKSKRGRTLLGMRGIRAMGFKGKAQCGSCINAVAFMQEPQ